MMEPIVALVGQRSHGGLAQGFDAVHAMTAGHLGGDAGGNFAPIHLIPLR